MLSVSHEIRKISAAALVQKARLTWLCSAGVSAADRPTRTCLRSYALSLSSSAQWGTSLSLDEDV